MLLNTGSGTVVLRPGRWRRVGGNRFVPPGAPASSPIFVEWRREGDAWVVAAAGASLGPLVEMSTERFDGVPGLLAARISLPLLVFGAPSWLILLRQLWEHG